MSQIRSLTLAIDPPYSGDTLSTMRDAPDLHMVARNIDLLMRACSCFHSPQELCAAADRARDCGVAAARFLTLQMRAVPNSIARVGSARFRGLPRL